METKEPKGERVRRSTSTKQNAKIDSKILDNIDYYIKHPSEIPSRIKKLDKEWDIERVLETNMSILALTGLALAVFVDPYWLILPGLVLLFFLQHALQGWCPPIPLFRAMGVRTRPEIDREKYALKAIRGDFSTISNTNPQTVFEAVSAN
jgi:hypothetical protein